jgi:hypothetical protein
MNTIRSNELLTEEAWQTIWNSGYQNHDKLKTTHPLNKLTEKIYSQNGEEGILVAILNKIGFTNKVCVDFGACDGIRISNTLYFKNVFGFRRILIEGGGPDKWPNRTNGEKLIYSLVTPDNINQILAQENCPEIYDLLSLDIDGDDYWVWEAMTKQARVVVVEYHPSIPNNLPLTITSSQTDVRSHLIPDGGGWNYRGEKETVGQFTLNGYYGANLRAFYNLAKQKGYQFCTTIRDNAIFVLNDEFSKLGLPPVTRDDCINNYNCPIEYWWEHRDQFNREWIILEE